MELSLENDKNTVSLDIGCITTEFPSQKVIEKYVTIGHILLFKAFPKDSSNQIPQSILKFQSANGEQHVRNWLVWSQQKLALYCFSHELFLYKTSSSVSKSALALAEDWILVGSCGNYAMGSHNMKKIHSTEPTREGQGIKPLINK